jgi:hypothetical protein
MISPRGAGAAEHDGLLSLEGMFSAGRQGKSCPHMPLGRCHASHVDDANPVLDGQTGMTMDWKIIHVRRDAWERGVEWLRWIPCDVERAFSLRRLKHRPRTEA